MRCLKLIALLGFLAATVSFAAEPAAKIDLAILYAGHPGSAREKELVDFLKLHFRQVDTADLAGLTDEATQRAGVVLLDYDGDGFKAPRSQLSRSYTRATVTLGVIGAFICDRFSLKTGYL